MKQKLLSKVMFLLFALIAGSTSVWADDVLYYTLDGTVTGGTNGYATESDITQSGMDWKVTGNTTLGPWRIGGKSLSDVDRAAYSATAMGSAITKVELTVGAASSITVNSLKLIVASDADFTTQIDEVSKTFTANSTITFTPTSGTEWTTGAYYKFVFNVTVSGNNNKYVEFSSAEFYKAEAAPAYTITAESNNESYGTVSLSGSTITATPASGYRVSTSNPYTVTDGTATVSQTGNTFTVTPSENCTVQINFEAIPTYAVTIETPEGGTLTVKNGETPVSSGQSFVAGTVLTITATPSADYNFRNWQAVDASTHTYTLTFTYTMTEHAVTIKANFDAKEYHNAIFSINGNTDTKVKTEKGHDIEFPDNPATIFGKVFKGWTASPIAGTTDEEPDYVTSAEMGDADVTYFAVFATQEGGGGSSTIELTNETIVSNATGHGSYSNDYNIDGWTGRYLINNNSGSYSLQLGYNTESSKSAYNSHLTTPTSSANITSVTINTKNNTASGRTFYLCNATNLGCATADGATYGQGSITEANGSVTIPVTGTTTQLHIYPNGTAYLASVSVTYATVSYSGYCTTIGYSRTVEDGNFGTICLPCATTAAPEGATFYRVGGTTENGVMLVEHDGALAAGTPYVFKATASEISANYTGEAAEVKTATGLVGNLSATPLNVPTDCYVLSNNKLRKVATGGAATVGQYRAYFNLSLVGEYPSGGASVKAVVLGWNEATGIDLPATEKAEKVIFDLSGRRVEKPTKGLYIVNGKKVLF